MGDDKANIFILRHGKEYGPYSVDTVNEYLESGELLVDDLGWSEDIGFDNIPIIEMNIGNPGDRKKKKWVKLCEIQGVAGPRKLPPPPGFVDREDKDQDEASGCLAAFCFFIPLLGFILWLAYINSNHKKSSCYGSCALCGLIAGIFLLILTSLH